MYFSVSLIESTSQHHPSVVSMPTSIKDKNSNLGVIIDGSTIQPSKLLTMNEDQDTDIAHKDRSSKSPSPIIAVLDNRYCVACKVGADSTNEGRLIFFDFNQWVHAKCLVWSHEAVEGVDGGICNAQDIVHKAKEHMCFHCQRRGATVQCRYNGCGHIFHYGCTKKTDPLCLFTHNRQFYCGQHAETILHPEEHPILQPTMITKEDGSVTVIEQAIPLKVDGPPPKPLRSHNLLRRIYVADDIRTSHYSGHRPQPKKWKEDIGFRLRIGSVVIHQLGRIKEDILFSTSKCLYPVGFKSSRRYLSYTEYGMRIVYYCEIFDANSKFNVMNRVSKVTDEEARMISENKSHDDQVRSITAGPIFKVTAEDDLQNPIWASSASEAWMGVFQRVRKLIGPPLGQNGGYKKTSDQILGEYMFGLRQPGTIRYLEGLSDVERCVRYQGMYKIDRLVGTALYHPHGCARAIPYSSKKILHHDTHISVNKKANATTNGNFMADANNHVVFVDDHVDTTNNASVNATSSSLNVPLSIKYRQLKASHKKKARVRKSPIQGWGLFANDDEDLEEHEMIIEYIGEIIGAEVAEKREKMYKNAIYMFKLEDDRIVDATKCGNEARFINHSCEPNCYSRVLPIDGRKRILIFSLKKISAGAELTYDYQLPFEETDRIPCRCTAKTCRGWLN